MPVIQLVFRHSGPPLAAIEPSGVWVRPACPTVDSRLITGLVESCHMDGGPLPTGGGLLIELVSRPGRSVSPWLATVGGEPAGLVALVASRGGAVTRHSIAWLFVVDRARRRGVGRALVAVAIRAALSAGAREVWVETKTDWRAALAFWNAVGFRPVP